MFSCKSTQQALQSVEIQVGELAEEVTQFMSRWEKYFVKVEAQEGSPVNEHDLEEDEEKVQQREQWITNGLGLLGLSSTDCMHTSPSPFLMP